MQPTPTYWFGSQPQQQTYTYFNGFGFQPAVNPHQTPYGSAHALAPGTPTLPVRAPTQPQPLQHTLPTPHLSVRVNVPVPEQPVSRKTAPRTPVLVGGPAPRTGPPEKKLLAPPSDGKFIDWDRARQRTRAAVKAAFEGEEDEPWAPPTPDGTVAVRLASARPPLGRFPMRPGLR